jgi:methyl-accepting chemotaxis protein
LPPVTGSRLAHEAGTTIADVVAQVKGVADLIEEIGAAFQDQTRGIGDIGGSVAQLDRATQQNATLVEHSALAAESLRRQTAHMIELVGRFRLGPSSDTRVMKNC